MKLTYTMAAIAATTLGASAATSFVNLNGLADDRINTVGVSGQTFLYAGTDTSLKSIAIQGPRDTPVLDVFFLEVWTNLGGTNGFSLGGLVATSVDSYALDTVDASQTWNFSDETLTDGQSYFVRFTDGLGTDVATRVGYENGAYADGEGINNGALFGGGWDAAMTVNTDAPVPEPSSTALLGLGGLALILRRRK